MDLWYDQRDDHFHEKHGSQILYWLDDLGARQFDEAGPAAEGFLFAGARPIEDYRRLVADHPLIRDRPEERAPLLGLDSVLDCLHAANAAVPTPKTWRLPVDSQLPTNLTFPLFVRTSETSWKLGGKVSKVRNRTELEEEATALRRAIRWDALILAREWLDLAVAGDGTYGPIPQEVRVWIVDGLPFAWSFHYMNILKAPLGFPPTDADLRVLVSFAVQVGSAFHSRLIAADFGRFSNGNWCFIEAGPGSCAGTEHEAVFKAVAGRLKGESIGVRGDAVGGLLTDFF
jgi:ATP-grasp domain, R2K clade family 3